MDKKIQKIIVSGILTNNQGKVLLAQRPMHKKIAPGAYHLPGGHVEFGETPEQAVVREFEEEFKLYVQPGEVVRTFSYTIEDSHTIGITFTITSDDTPENITFDKQDTESVIWINESEMGKYLGPSDHDCITLVEFFKKKEAN